MVHKSAKVLNNQDPSSVYHIFHSNAQFAIIFSTATAHKLSADLNIAFSVLETFGDASNIFSHLFTMLAVSGIILARAFNHLDTRVASHNIFHQNSSVRTVAISNMFSEV
jgi:hypothetical protein